MLYASMNFCKLHNATQRITFFWNQRECVLFYSASTNMARDLSNNYREIEKCSLCGPSLKLYKYFFWKNYSKRRMNNLPRKRKEALFLETVRNTRTHLKCLKIINCTYRSHFAKWFSILSGMQGARTFMQQDQTVKGQNRLWQNWRGDNTDNNGQPQPQGDSEFHLGANLARYLDVWSNAGLHMAVSSVYLSKTYLLLLERQI